MNPFVCVPLVTAPHDYYFSFLNIVIETHEYVQYMSKIDVSRILGSLGSYATDSSVVTTFSLTLYLQKGINRGREVHERELELLHCYDGGIGTLISPTFSLEYISLCCRAWRLSSLEKRSSITRSRFCEVPNLKRRYICTCFQD